MRREWKQKINCILCGLVLVLALSGCGISDFAVDRGSKADKEPYLTKDELPQKTGDENGNPLYLVMSNSSSAEALRVYNYMNGQTYQFHYSLSTSFLDKYGNLTVPEKVSTGKIVILDEVDSEGILQTVQVTDEVWEYTDIERFSIDEEREIFKIADTKYTWKNNLFVFSDEDIKSLSDILPEDKLTVVGVDRQILAVIITTGHGTLRFTNTDLFEDSYAQIGKRIFAKVTKDMSLEVPEGKYMVAVANNGWGGNKEVTVKRGETTTLDLDKLKGDGPSFGKILFRVDVEGAKIAIDDELIDYSQPIDLQYGEHKLTVTADGYDVWNRKLYVNSKEATIMITLNDEEEKKTHTASDDTEKEDSQPSTVSGSGSSSGSNSGSGSSTGKDSDDALKDYLSTLTKERYLKDYLSTISSLIGSIN